MTGLLVSVRTPDEARAALAGDADIIDIKEPSRGALGPADPAVWRAVLEVVGGRVPVSAALGELAADPIESLAEQASGLAFIKVGLAKAAADNHWQARFRQAIARLAAPTLAVPVAYADWQAAEAPAPRDVLRFAATMPARLLLIDTAHKRSGTLLDYLPLSELEQLAREARLQNVQFALAGSLQSHAIRALLPLRPAYFGVRGAACTGGRAGTVDSALVKCLAQAIRGNVTSSTAL